MVNLAVKIARGEEKPLSMSWNGRSTVASHVRNILDPFFPLCACVCVSTKAGAGGADAAEELTEEEGREILDMKNSANIYTDMVNSIAPTVFGHSEVSAITRTVGTSSLTRSYLTP